MEGVHEQSEHGTGRVEPNRNSRYYLQHKCQSMFLTTHVSKQMQDNRQRIPNLNSIPC